MKVLSRLVPAVAGSLLGVAALAVPALAAPAAHAGGSSGAGAVFVQTDNTAGNAVAAGIVAL